MEKGVRYERGCRRDQQSVIVVCAEEASDRDDAVTAWAVLNHDRLPPARR